MDWSFSSLNALPFGLVLFAGLTLGYLRRKGAHRRALQSYPELASELGLEYRAPRAAKESGQLYGKLKGFGVLVDPDDQRKLIVRFRGEPCVDLRSYESQRRPQATIPYVDPDRSINRYFPTRWASPEIAEVLQQANLRSLLAPILERYQGIAKELNITQHGVTCVLDFGHPRHIPPDAVRELLPVLLCLAEVIEPHSDGSEGSDGSARRANAESRVTETV